MAESGTDIIKAAHILSSGDIVAIPTETVYGLAGNALNSDAVLKIFKAKNRPHFDPLIVHYSSFDSISAQINGIGKQAQKLAEVFWPGPLTMLLPKPDNIPSLVTSGSDLVAVRVPNHPLTLQLLANLDFPLAAPSANPFGYVSPTSAVHVNLQLGDKIPYILDGGDCAVGLESTIISFENGNPVILRLGGLKTEEIEEVLGEKVSFNTLQHSNPKAPGQLDKHYATGAKMILTDDIESEILKYPGKNIELLLFGNQISDKYSNINLSKNGNIDEAAKNLFSSMRILDARNPDIIIAMKVPETGLGKAINDRLFRASVR
ncbi:MAG: threonylcarbamoyl-AMP synthase [Bacteroidia bacterium]|nr:threonylcarbamoyl-AMP synthase [Bacteroidia bacterium]